MDDGKPSNIEGERGGDKIKAVYHVGGDLWRKKKKSKS